MSSQISSQDRNVREYRLLADLFKDPSALTPAGQSSLSNINQFLTKPLGTSLDLTTGTLYVLDIKSTGATIVKIQPDSTGSFNTPTVTNTSIIGKVGSVSGLSFNSTTGEFQIWSSSQPIVYNATATGAVVSAQLPWELGVSPWGGGGTAPLANTTNGLPISRLQLVQNTKMSQYSAASPDPSGVVYIAHNNSLLISDAEVEEMSALYKGSNLFGVSLQGNLQYTLTTTNKASTLTGTTPGIVGYSDEPAGISYNSATKSLYVVDDDKDQVFQVNPGADGLYNTGDDMVTSLFSTRTFGAMSSDSDPEDIAYDPKTGNFFLIDGLSSDVYQVTTSGKLISQFDTAALGMVDPEAIAMLDNGNLAIIGGDPTISTHNNRNRIAEVTTDGKLVQWFDISAANPQKPAAITLAPSSNNPGQWSLYIVDRGLDNDDFPSENDGRLYEFSLGRAITNQAPVIDAGPVERVALSRTFFDGSLYDDGLSGKPVSTQWQQVAGAGTVSFTNPTEIDTQAQFSAPGSYVVQLSANDGLLSTTRQVAIEVLDAPNTHFVSFAAGGTVDGMTFADEDILAFNTKTNKWSMLFDGSDVGLGNFNVRDFHLDADGSILLTLNNTATIAGLGTVEASDIIRFTPTALGSTTAGTFSWFFDGSDVGLTEPGERLDAFTIAPDGRLILSTTGSSSVMLANGKSLSGQDEDLLAFAVGTSGETTAGSWSMLFDGSNVGLVDTLEDVDGVWMDSAGRLYMTTEGAYEVPSASASLGTISNPSNSPGADLLTFTPTSLGLNTTKGDYSFFWSPASVGVTAGVGVDGFSRIR